MAKLSAEETNLLKRLQAKKDAPDPEPTRKSLNISVDLGDEKQVETARKLGLLDWITGADDDDKDDDDKDDDDKDDDDKDDVPRRRGFFPDS